MVLRPESSVSVGFDEYGELVFPSDLNGPVIHRTPEELGLPRVLPGNAPRREFKEVWRAELNRMAKERHERTEDVPVRTIRGVQVRMPEHAVMGAELIDLIADDEAAKRAAVEEEQPQILRGAQDDKREEEGDMPRGKYMRSGGQPCAEPGCEWRAYGGKLYCSKRHFYKNKLAGQEVAKKASRIAGKASALQRVEIDPERKGTADSLLNALAKVDGAGRIAIQLELSAAELATVIDKLGRAQKTAFVAAGLRAALLC